MSAPEGDCACTPCQAKREERECECKSCSSARAAWAEINASNARALERLEAQREALIATVGAAAAGLRRGLQ